MADPEMDEDLFADLYDGEADDPAPPTKETKAEPEVESQPVTTQPAEPVQRDFDTTADASEDFDFKTEPDAGIEGMQGVQDNQQGFKQEHSNDFDKPISIKDDGYV